MKVVTLIENRSSHRDARLVAEWGLALHIEYGEHKILFDSGASGVFAKNAEHLSVDLASVDTAVLSHHHFDHGGGLRRFLKANATAGVYLGRAPMGECFTKVFLFKKKYVGLDNSLFADFPNRFSTVNQPAEILPNVFIFPRISEKYPKPLGNARLMVRKEGKFVPDDFSHEIVMAIKENDQLVIFTGCAHQGILNMIDTVANELKGIPIKAVVGGFHLVSTPLFNTMAGGKVDVEQLGKKMLEYPVGQTFTGHCTGMKAFAVLKAVMGDRLTDLVTGSQFEI